MRNHSKRQHDVISHSSLQTIRRLILKIFKNLLKFTRLRLINICYSLERGRESPFQGKCSPLQRIHPVRSADLIDTSAAYARSGWDRVSISKVSARPGDPEPINGHIRYCTAACLQVLNVTRPGTGRVRVARPLTRVWPCVVAQISQGK